MGQGVQFSIYDLDPLVMWLVFNSLWCKDDIFVVAGLFNTEGRCWYVQYALTHFLVIVIMNEIVVVVAVAYILPCLPQ